MSNLIEVASGEEVFAHLRGADAARDRIVSSADVMAVRPDVIPGVVVRYYLWCN